MAEPESATAKKIQLTKGLFAWVDATDFEWLNQWPWYAHKSRRSHYAARRKEGEFLYMHRLILGITDPKTLADHIDGNGLNNRRINIRVATHTNNACNQGKAAIRCSSKFIGVYKSSYGERWVAQIKINRQAKYLGTFDTQEEAALVRDAAATAVHGPFARLNFGVKL